MTIVLVRCLLGALDISGPLLHLELIAIYVHGYFKQCLNSYSVFMIVSHMIKLKIKRNLVHN